jgi:O-Antigen ligase
MSNIHTPQTQTKGYARKRISSTYVEELPDKSSSQQTDKSKRAPIQEEIDEATFAWPFVIFQFSICLPIFLYIGGSRIAPYKIFLLLALLPSILKLIISKRTSFNFGDAMIIGYTALAAASIINRPWSDSTLEPVLSIILETSGSYFLARAFVTSAAAFKILIKTQLFLVITIGLLSVYESISGTNIIFKFFSTAFQTFAVSDMPARLGLHRAQGTFEHPILYGVYSSLIFGLCFMGLKISHTNFQRYLRLALVFLATFVSLSTGAYISIIGQLAFIGWEKYVNFTRHRWRLLFALCVAAFFVVDGLSNRSPFEVFISYLTFDTNSAYNRVLIWTYGIAEVWRNPLIGMGLFEDWVRPPWMIASIDNFFLLRAMRHGVIALLLLIGLIIWIVTKLSNLKIENHLIHNYRMGFLVTIGGLCISLITVDLWSGLHSYFFFLLGSSVWMIDRFKKLNNDRIDPASALSKAQDN